MANNQKTLIALIAGAAAGAIAGLLLAPASGRETRDKLSQKANDLKGNLNDTWETSKERLKTLADTAKSEVEKYTKKPQPTTENLNEPVGNDAPLL